MGGRTVKGVAIGTLAQGGEGLGYLPDGKVVFVRGALPGDVVEVRIRKEKKSWARGEVESLEVASPHRVESGCDAFSRGCGGCQFWNTTYEQELAWKSEAAFEVMKRISKVELPAPQIVAALARKHYRTGVIFHQKKARERVFRGFYAAGTNRVVPVDSCPIADEAINQAISELGAVFDLVGAADMRVETAGKGQVVVLIERFERAPLREEVLDKLDGALRQSSVVKGIEVAQEGEEKITLGDCRVFATEVLARAPAPELPMKAGQFRQANRALNQELVSFVQEAVKKRCESWRVLELFCGAGNFSFALAEDAKGVLGVEGSEQAVEHARAQAAKFAGEAQLEFRVADLSDGEVIDRLLEEPFEVLVLDPPRRGAPEVASRLGGAGRGELIVYISCDIACLARDLRQICDGGWQVEELSFFDMFPRTSHLEAVAVLSRR